MSYATVVNRHRLNRPDCFTPATYLAERFHFAEVTLIRAMRKLNTVMKIAPLLVSVPLNCGICPIAKRMGMVSAPSRYSCWAKTVLEPTASPSRCETRGTNRALDQCCCQCAQGQPLARGSHLLDHNARSLSNESRTRGAGQRVRARYAA